MKMIRKQMLFFTFSIFLFFVSLNYVYAYTDLDELSNNGWYLSLVTCTNFDGKVSLKETYRYDQEGNLKEKVYYYDDGECDELYRYQYTKSDLLQTVTRIYFRDSLRTVTKMEKSYDRKGHLTNEIDYYDNGNKREEREYNTNGEIIKTSSYNYSGMIESISTNDQYGNILKETIFDDSGEEESSTEFSYKHNGKITNGIGICNIRGTGDISVGQIELQKDENGNLLYEKMKLPSGRVISMEEYEYDSYGNNIKTVSYTGEVPLSRSESLIEYDANGDVVSYKRYEDDWLAESYTNTYDSFDHLLSHTVYDSDEEMKRIEEFSYDENGCLVEKVVKDADGGQKIYRYYYLNLEQLKGEENGKWIRIWDSLNSQTQYNCYSYNGDILSSRNELGDGDYVNNYYQYDSERKVKVKNVTNVSEGNKSSERYEYKYYGDDGFDASVYDKDGNYYESITKEYDSEGRITKNHVLRNGVIFNLDYEYDTDGKLIIYNFAGNNNACKIYYNYDNQGRCTANVTVYLDEDGKEESRKKTEYEYLDCDDGSLLEYQFSSYGDMSLIILKHEYDENGNEKRKTVCLDDSGEMNGTLEEYEYVWVPDIP